MTLSEIIRADLERGICPVCKRPLQSNGLLLWCISWTHGMWEIL